MAQMIHKSGFFALLAFLMSVSAAAQKTELNFSLGTSHFLGDLGGKPGLGSNDPSDLDLQGTRWVTGIGFRYRPHPRFALRYNAYYGRLAGNDAWTTNPERKARNLNFFSYLFETGLNLEYFLGEEKKMYLFAGAGVCMFNPKTTYNGTVYALQPLGTEGQNYITGAKPYKLNAMVFPLGMGFRLKQFSNRAILGLELSARITSSDYIDDVSGFYADKNLIAAKSGTVAGELADRSKSTIPGFSEPGAIRGDNKDNDNYFFVTVTYNLPLSKRSMYDDFGRGKIRKHKRARFMPGRF